MISGAGFTLTSEALYLGKKLLIIPQKNQYEQQCNTVALASLGVAYSNAWPPKNLKNWLLSKKTIKRKFHTKSTEVIKTIQKRFNI